MVLLKRNESDLSVFDREDFAGFADILVANTKEFHDETFWEKTLRA